MRPRSDHPNTCHCGKRCKDTVCAECKHKEKQKSKRIPIPEHLIIEMKQRGYTFPIIAEVLAVNYNTVKTIWLTIREIREEDKYPAFTSMGYAFGYYLNPIF